MNDRNQLALFATFLYLYFLKSIAFLYKKTDSSFYFLSIWILKPQINEQDRTFKLDQPFVISDITEYLFLMIAL